LDIGTWRVVREEWVRKARAPSAGGNSGDSLRIQPATLGVRDDDGAWRYKKMRRGVLINP
jgi:hypothetical protein